MDRPGIRAARSWLAGFLVLAVSGAVLACLFGSIIFAITGVLAP